MQHDEGHRQPDVRRRGRGQGPLGSLYLKFDIPRKASGGALLAQRAWETGTVRRSDYEDDDTGVAVLQVRSVRPPAGHEPRRRHSGRTPGTTVVA